MQTYGTCDECGVDDVGAPDPFGIHYCNQCWHTEEVFDNLRRYRCFTVCAVYRLSDGARLAVGGSMGHCAERDALWRCAFDPCPKALVVARVRKNRNNTKWSFGDSKPCQQCLWTMALCNVQRVCYSDAFDWTDTGAVHNEYRSFSNVVLRF